MLDDLYSWTKFIEKEDLKAKIGERKVYIWGIAKRGYFIANFLKQINIDIAGYISNDKSKNTDTISEEISLPHEILDKKRNFIIVTIENYSYAILELLKKYDYTENKDYLYLFYEIRLRKAAHFIDNHGNRIEGRVNEVQVEISGYNNKISVGKNVVFGKACKLVLKGNGTIIIGDNCSFSENFVMVAGEEGVISYGNNCQYDHSGYVTCIGGRINVGNHCTSGFHLYMATEKNGEIYIGNDCMFSHNVKIRTTPGHAIFDLEKKVSFNEVKTKSIEIESHVWLGFSAILLGNVRLRKKSIVGAGSFVRGEFSDNCVIAGNPAQVIQEDVDWDRDNNLNFEEWNLMRKENENENF